MVHVNQFNPTAFYFKGTKSYHADQLKIKKRSTEVMVALKDLLSAVVFV